MALKLVYYGQNDSVNCIPDATLTGDPGTDQATLTAFGYLGGTIMAVAVPAVATSNEAVIVPCNPEGVGNTHTAVGTVPFGTLLNGPGEFSGAIGPSGSKKAPVVRAMWQGNVNSEAYDTGATWTLALGAFVYCGGNTNSLWGKYTLPARLSAGRQSAISTNPRTQAVGIITHIPITAEPWLGVASLL